MSKPVFFLDTEFNGFGGHLVSIALAGLDGAEFYEPVILDEKAEPWVAKNVLPVLGKTPVSRDVLADRLCEFLSRYLQHEKIQIIADWPADIEHFMHCLLDPQNPGQMIAAIEKIEIFMDRSLRFYESVIPHNALEDARAMRTLYTARQKESVPA